MIADCQLLFETFTKRVEEGAVRVISWISTSERSVGLQCAQSTPWMHCAFSNGLPYYAGVMLLFQNSHLPQYRRFSQCRDNNLEPSCLKPHLPQLATSQIFAPSCCQSARRTQRAERSCDDVAPILKRISESTPSSMVRSALRVVCASRTRAQRVRRTWRGMAYRGSGAGHPSAPS